MRSIEDTLLRAFDRWFTSSTGVIQTLVVTVIVVVLEAVVPSVDPNGFLLLYWLTVYSAVTQPALAHAGKESADRLEVAIRRIEQLASQVAEVEQRQNVMLEQLLKR